MPKKSKPRQQAAAKKKSQPQLIVSVADVESKNVSSDIVGGEHDFHAIPNIPDLVVRGGWDRSSGEPYRLGAFENNLTMDAYGANTCSMVSYVARGWEKDIFAARQICIAHPGVSPSDIEERYSESFRFMGREWIERNIIDRKDATDHREMAHEIDDKVRSYPTIGPALREYPLIEHDTRPPEVQQGQIVARYYEQLQKMRQVSRPRPLSEDALRKRFPDFEVWAAVIDKKTPQRRAALFSDGFGSIRTAKQEALFDCIAGAFHVGIHTLMRWYKAYRKDSGKARARHKSK